MMDAAAAAAAVAAELQSPVYESVPNPTNYEREPGEQDVFDPKVHLDLRLPDRVFGLHEIGYDDENIKTMRLACEAGNSTCFSLLSAEGVAALRRSLARIENHVGTSPRIPAVHRGTLFRSKFVEDLTLCPEVAAHVSRIAGTPLAPHPMRIQNGHTNYKPKNMPDKPVDRWHVDTTPFVVVIFLTDPKSHEGGRFEFFNGTMMEAESVLRANDGVMPRDKVVQPEVPAAGYAVFQQGTAVMHRASAVTKGDERITFVQSFASPVPGAFGGCDHLSRSYNTVDPLHVLFPDWARFRAWMATNLVAHALQPEATDATAAGDRVVQTQRALEAVPQLTAAMRMPYTDDRERVATMLHEAVDPIRTLAKDANSDAARKALDEAIATLESAANDVLTLSSSTMSYF